MTFPVQCDPPSSMWPSHTNVYGCFGNINKRLRRKQKKRIGLENVQIVVPAGNLPIEYFDKCNAVASRLDCTLTRLPASPRWSFTSFNQFKMKISKGQLLYTQLTANTHAFIEVKFIRKMNVDLLLKCLNEFFIVLDEVEQIREWRKEDSNLPYLQ